MILEVILGIGIIFWILGAVLEWSSKDEKNTKVLNDSIKHSVRHTGAHFLRYLFK